MNSVPYHKLVILLLSFIAKLFTLSHANCRIDLLEIVMIIGEFNLRRLQCLSKLFFLLSIMIVLFRPISCFRLSSQCILARLLAASGLRYRASLSYGPHAHANIFHEAWMFRKFHLRSYTLEVAIVRYLGVSISDM